MAHSYEVVRGKTPEEALDNSKWKPGELARVTELTPIANSDGTYTVVPTFERFEEDQN